MHTWLIGVVGLVLSSALMAAPVVSDDADVTIFVTRPVDSWSADVERQAASLGAIENRTFGYAMLLQDKSVLKGTPQMFASVSDHPITQGVLNQIQNIGGELTYRGGYIFEVAPAVSIVPEEFAGFQALQEAQYREKTKRLGNPDTLSNRLSDAKTKRVFLQVVGAAATTLIGAKVLGPAVGTTTGAQIGLGEAGTLSAAIFRKSAAAIVAAPTPNLDPTKYTRIDIRRVNAVDTEGQIIIAYKGDKTAELENAAMIKAILAVGGVDTTREAVQQARIEDLERRKAMWLECVDAGLCSKETE